MPAPCEEVYLRRAAAGDPLPAGWRAHPAGTMGGVALDFVYKPARHDVCRALGGVTECLATGLGEAGYRRTAELDGGWELWVRDRPTALRARLAGLRVIEGGRARSR